MADAFKATLSMIYSENSDYSDPEYTSNWSPHEETPDEYMAMTVEAATGGTTVTTTHLASAVAVAVINTDSTNYVDVTFDSAANSSVDNIIRVAAGDFMYIPDFTVAQNLVLTANTAACICKVVIVGS